MCDAHTYDYCYEISATLAITELAAFMDRSEHTASSESSGGPAGLVNDRIAGMSTRSVTWTRNARLILELRETFSECSSENWDGCGALPLKEQAVLEAERFISVMPIFMPDPEIAPEPSGDIGFQWSFGENRIFAISLEGRNIVTYAAILGSSERTKCGREIFNDSMPQEVILGVEEISSRSSTNSQWNCE